MKQLNNKVFKHLPSKLKIGGKVYKVEQVYMIEDRETHGINHYDQQLIQVATRSACREAAEETLLHEALHAMENKLSLDLSEKDVHSLSEELYSFLKRNKAWWTCEEDE